METPVALALIAAVAPLLSALAVYIGHRNTRKLDRMEVRVDGRLTQLLKVTKSAAFAAGVKKSSRATPRQKTPAIPPRKTKPTK